MYMTRGSLSTEHSTRRFGSDCPRRIIFAAFHVGSKRNCGGDWHSCVNTGCPFVVAVIERSVRFPLSRSFQLSATCPDTPALENVSPVVRFTTFHSPQLHPTDIVSSVRDRIPSQSASRPNTTSTPFDGVVSSSIRTENSFASFRDASNTQLVTTSQSSYTGGGMVDTTSAAARNVVASVMALFPSGLIPAKINVQLYQRLFSGMKFIGHKSEAPIEKRPTAVLRYVGVCQDHVDKHKTV